MKHCQYCGAKLKPGQKVCDNCHRKVEEPGINAHRTSDERDLEQEITGLEEQLHDEKSNKNENIIHHLAFTGDHFRRVFQFLVHDLLTTIILLLIAIIAAPIRWYAIVVIVLLTYAYPLLSGHDYYPWEKWLKAKRQHHAKEKTQNKQQEKKHSPKSSKNKVIITLLVVIIIILIGLIIFFIASTKSTSSAPARSQATTVQRSSSKEKASSHSAKANSSTEKATTSSQQHSQQLSSTNMDDKLKAAAAYYYASEHQQKMFEFNTAVQQKGLSLGNNVSAEYQKGSDPVSVIPLNTGSGTVPFFTTDGDTVYFYVPSAMPPEALGEDSDDDSDQPVLTATWQEICDLVNQNGAYDQVKKVADNSKYVGE